ncbi:MAG: ABC transporter permease [Chitinophagaceae bacterium]|nr:ABC transporter permease [Chitinophagaceae bacterium]
MKLRDTLSLAFRTVRSNRLRTGITVAIIAFGIMALVGINTAIDAMKQKFMESFSAMGANGFTIHFREWNMGFDRSSVKSEKKGQRKLKKSNAGKPITKNQAETFEERFKYPAKISLTMFGVPDGVVSLGDKKTNPTVRVYGGDPNWVDLNGYNVVAGRNLNDLDVQSGRNVCVLGSDLAARFFGSDPNRPVEKVIRVNGLPFRVVGVLDSKGSTLGMSWDNMILTSYNNVRRFFNSNPNASFSILVKVTDVRTIDGAIDQAEGILRPIRQLAVTEDNNFYIDKSDSGVAMLMRNLSFITLSAVLIGVITLVGAAVGLMNIMLVSVTERTKEIGLIKAIGGRQRNVRQQFLFESVLISLIGAGFGVVLGVIVGNSFSLILHTGFVVPWAWLLGGIVLCTIVGLLAGLYPSLKASKLNPIEALRYE